MTEAKIIKRAMKIPYNCYNTELYQIIGIKPLHWAMKKRKVTFLRQILENPITSEMILSRETSMEYILVMLGIEQGAEDKELILARCNSETSRINMLETVEEASEYSRILEHLWRNRDADDNEETLMLMFMAQHGMRGIFTSSRGDAG